MKLLGEKELRLVFSGYQDVPRIARIIVEFLITVLLWSPLSYKIRLLREFPQLVHFRIGATCALIASIILLILLVRQRGQNKPTERVLFWEAQVETFMIIWLIFIFGGMNSLFFFFFPMALIENALTLNPLALLIAILAGVSTVIGEYIWLIWGGAMFLNATTIFALFYRVIAIVLIGQYSYTFIQTVLKEREAARSLRQSYEELERSKGEIEEKTEKLERWYELTVGREMKMIELKRKIKELEGKVNKK